MCACPKYITNRRSSTPLPLIPAGPRGCTALLLRANCGGYVPPLALVKGGERFYVCSVGRLLEGLQISSHSPLSSLPPLISLPFFLSVHEGSWCWNKLRHPLTFFASANGCLHISWLQAILITLEKQTVYKYARKYSKTEDLLVLVVQSSSTSRSHIWISASVVQMTP